MPAEPQHRTRVAVIGSGPVGIEAALAARECGWPVRVYEQGPRIADSMRRWGHVHLFTPWSFNLSVRMKTVLSTSGAPTPDETTCPTGAELAEVLDQINQLVTHRLPPDQMCWCLETRVLSIGRQGLLKHEAIGGGRENAPFRILVRGPEGERIDEADLVFDCSGTYRHPNPVGADGIPAPGEADAEVGFQAGVTRHLVDFAAESEDWIGHKILLVGGGHSAMTAAVALADLVREHPITQVTWMLRSDPADWLIDDEDPLPERKKLQQQAQALVAPGSPFALRIGAQIERIKKSEGDRRLRVYLDDDAEAPIEVDRILSLTGYSADDSIYRGLQVHECYATGAPMKLSAALLAAGGLGGDCLAQPAPGADTLTNPEPGFFILGAKSYGRNSAFLMRNGYEQVEDVVRLLADIERERISNPAA